MLRCREEACHLIAVGLYILRQMGERGRKWDEGNSSLLATFHTTNLGALRCGRVLVMNQICGINLLFWPSCKSITSLGVRKRSVRSACSEYTFVLPRGLRRWSEGSEKEKEVSQSEYDECALARGGVGGPCLSAPLLLPTAELQANKPHYHRRHRRQISLQRLSAVHINRPDGPKHAPTGSTRGPRGCFPHGHATASEI